MPIFRRKREPERIRDLRIIDRDGEIELRWKDLEGIIHNVWIPISAHRKTTFKEYDQGKEKET